MDAKAVANDFDIPLVLLCGLNNEGRTFVYLMAFLADETGKSIQWFLQSFRECMSTSPKLIACHQDTALIGAIWEVLPSTLVILDDWHLNQNQKRNTESEARKRNATWTSNDMERALFALRRSRGVITFQAQRRAFEQRYSINGDIPRWYNNLCHMMNEKFVHCFNRKNCGLRFNFQGSGYAETGNSMYKKAIIDRGIPLSLIPEDIRIETLKRKASARERDAPVRFRTEYDLVLAATHGYTTERWIKLMSEHNNFGMELFVRGSMRKASRYSASHPYTSRQNGQSDSTLVFDFKYVETESERVIHEVTVQ